MDYDAAIFALERFTPTGDEGRDIAAVVDLIDRLGELKSAPGVREAMIGIFERHPKADLGSPGPIVHSLEEAPLDEHVRLLVGSLARKPAAMVVWMSERCFRSPKLGEENRVALLQALRDARLIVNDGEAAVMLDETLAEHGA